MSELQLPEPYCQEPERYRVLSNGTIFDNISTRIVRGAGCVDVTPEQDTRITSDREHKQSGTALNKVRWDRTRQAVREAIVATAINKGSINTSKGASEVIADGVSTIWTESLKSKNKLGDRIKAQQHVIRIAEPGLMLDERQRSSDGLPPGGMRLELSEGAVSQLLDTLAGVAGDTVEGESRELVDE